MHISWATTPNNVTLFYVFIEQKSGESEQSLTRHPIQHRSFWRRINLGVLYIS